MKEGTVSRGVALRPRPTEVQPHFLGSNIYFGIFYESEVSRFIPTSVTILFLVLARFIPTSVTKFFFVCHVYIDFCY